MISVEDTTEFIPYGRDTVSHHPQGVIEGCGVDLIHPQCVRDGCEIEMGVGGEWWEVTEESNEEVYTRGNTAVWSVGGRTHKCFTLFEPIEECLRVTFHTYPTRPAIHSVPIPEEPTGDPLPSLVIRDSSVIRVFTQQGQDFHVALQFAVKKCWPTKFGLLIERAANSLTNYSGNDGGSPVIFSLLHPLDDFTRVVTKRSGGLCEWLDHQNVIIFTSCDPSLAVTYNIMTERHSVWRVRRATQQEAESQLVTAGDNTAGGASSGLTGSLTPSSYLRLPPSHSPSVVITPNRLQSPRGLLTTPLHSRSTTPLHSRTHSPLSHGGSRTGSPLSSMANILRGGQSPNISGKVTARFSPLAKSMVNEEGEMSTFEDKPLPLEVTMCLDHLWTEPVNMSGSRSQQAVKVFLTTDCVDQNMICFLSPNHSLDVIKMERANDSSQKIIFGAVRKIPAVDAAPISGLSMILVLDPTGGITLYTGSTKICRVHLPPSPAMQTLLLSQEISALALDSKPSTPLNHKRSSLLTSSRPPSATLPNFGNDSCLSPVSVTENSHTPHITQLCDPLSHQITLRYSNDKLLTVKLPTVAGPLVTVALLAVKQLLPRELAVLLHSSWYTARHAPGPTPSPAKEWDMFCRCLLGLAGYQVDLLDLSTGPHNTSIGLSQTGAGPSKKCRQSETGSDGDWQFLLCSAHHREVGDKVSRLLDLDNPEVDTTANVNETVATGEVNSNAPLFNYIPAIMWSLHLLYEEFQLDQSQTDHLPHLSSLLLLLATDLQLPHYHHHYWTDLPHDPPTSQLTPTLLSKLSPTPGMSPHPPVILDHLTNILCQKNIEPYPILPGVTTSSQTITICLATLISTPNSILNPELFLRPLPQPGRPQTSLPPRTVPDIPAHAVALTLCSSQWDKTSLARLPPTLSVPLLTALSVCQQSPASDWSRDVYRLVDRDDLARIPTNNRGVDRVQESPDGLEGLLSQVSTLRWPRDQRLVETRRLLQSSKPVTVSVIQRPEVSDHDFIEEQEHFLKRLCERTMALPVGRGAASLRTTTALPTETLEIPKLCLTGKAPPRGAKVELSHIDVSQNMDHWPSFHNGVAAGLRLSTDPSSHDIDSTWICFNKPRAGEGTAQTEHAGFLMALGLNGHLSKLGKLESFDYLMKGSEPISIGLLLGMSASRRGSMDVLVTKKLATQLEALLPPTATELPLSHNTQVAALMGLGLLYSDTGHRRMVEVCLKELGRLPGPELENCVDRESYSVTAGLALGMITMGRGEALVSGGLADLCLPEELHNHMVGGPRPPLTSSSRERPPSYQIKEGDSINIDVTSPGATLALGMMYWRSGNMAVASWMEAPDTSFLLEFVRPDFLMLRTLAKGLIMWDSIQPSLSWVEGQVPAAILPHCLVRPPDNPPPGQQNLDYETINQAYCNIVAGACFVLALRFAGTWNQAAYDTLEQLTNKLIAVSKRSIADLTGRAVIEQTICVLVLSQGLVMAGSGDLATLRFCRMLRARVHSSTVVTYGSHMAIHMAIGLLFLGGGKLGLSTTPGSVAALICSFFPKFPTHSSDNRYHLQALRHLYVLAVEPRLIVPRCTETGKVVKCSLGLRYQATRSYPSTSITMEAPVLLPDLGLLFSVEVKDQDYWTVTFNSGEDWQGLCDLLQRGGCLPVKRKVGAGLETDLQWGLAQDQLDKLTNNPHCSTYLSYFLSDCPPSWLSSLQCLVTTCLANCVPDLLPTFTSLKVITNKVTNLSNLQVRQLQMMFTLARHQTASFPHPELTISLVQSAGRSLDRAGSQSQIGPVLLDYLSGVPPTFTTEFRRHLLASILSLHNLPRGDKTIDVQSKNPLKMNKLLRRSSTPATLYRMLNNSQ